MEPFELPTPNLPPVDHEKVIEELKCEVKIRKSCENYDAVIANLLKDRLQSVAAESQYVVQELLKDAKKLTQMRKREASQYEFELSKKRIEAHTLRQQLMTAHVNLTAAQDSLQHRERIAQHLKIHLELDKQANRSQNRQNAILRLKLNNLLTKIQSSQQNYSHLYSQLRSAQQALDQSEADVQELEERLKIDETRMKSELLAAQQRAKNAEDMLRQRDAIAGERARLEEDIKHYSKDLAKLALETGNAASAQLAEAQATLKTERDAKLKAEQRLARLEAELTKLQDRVKGKERRVASLEEALKQREVATPAGPRAVSAALDAVGAFVSDLGGEASPETEAAGTRGNGRRRAPVPLGRRGGRRAAASKVAKPHVVDDEEGEREAAEVVVSIGGRKPQQQGKKRSEHGSMDEWAMDTPTDDDGGGCDGGGCNDDGGCDGGGGGCDDDGGGEEISKLKGQQQQQQRGGKKDIATRKHKGAAPAKRRKKGEETDNVEEFEFEEHVNVKVDDNDGARNKPIKGEKKYVEEALAAHAEGEEDKENADMAACVNKVVDGAVLQQQPLLAVNAGVIVPQSSSAPSATGDKENPSSKDAVKPQAQRPILGRSIGAPGGGMTAPGGGKRMLLGVSSTVPFGNKNGKNEALSASMLFGNSFKVPRMQSNDGGNH